MALYVIGDLHLSGKVDKPMDVFGEQWVRHHEKIEENWRKSVQPEDTVLIPGDISWAMTLEEALVDLKWIHSLPGRKILIKGNHDYWWSSITKLNSLFEGMNFIQNNFFTHEAYAICGTRGWNSPNDHRFTSKDEKVYNREVNRLELSLEQARAQGYEKIIVMLHYPPTNEHLEPSLFTQMIEAYNVEHVVYGHLHGKDSFGVGLSGEHNGVRYHLTSCDYLNFDLLRLL